jgi:quinoprotein glucose dehydrogenase
MQTYKKLKDIKKLFNKLFNITVTFCFILFFSASVANEQNYFWHRSGANNSSNKFSTLNQIAQSNISDLNLAWVYRYKNIANIQTNPIFADGLIITANKSTLIAIRPDSGKEEWSLKFEDGANLIAKRGLSYFQGFLYVPTSSGIYKVITKTGKFELIHGEIFKYGESESFLPPILTDKYLFTANYLGTIESFNILSGKRNWVLDLTKDNVTPRIWSGFSFDQRNKILYVTTSNPGGLLDSNIGNGGNSCSLLAINSENGKILWKIQETIHDLWDLDLVGAPILTDIIINQIKIPAVIALSKTGNIILANRISGKLIYESSYKKLIKDPEYSSIKMLNIKKPESISTIYFNPETEFSNLRDNEKLFIQHKIRNLNKKLGGDLKDSEKILPVKNFSDIVIFGIHGGAEWPGGTLDDKSKILTIPSNNNPWILRSKFFDKNQKLTIEKVRKNKIYKNKCMDCHKEDLGGYFDKETTGDLYFPSLVGLTKKYNRHEFIDLNTFRYTHKYASKPKKNLQNLIDRGINKYIENKKLNAKLALVNTFVWDLSTKNNREEINSIHMQDLDSIYNLLIDVEKDIEARGDLGETAFWQLLLQQNGLPGSNPPWGYLTAVNLNNGKIKWRIPFGSIYDKESKKEIAGDINFGGAITIGSGIIFATGTRDSYIRAFNEENGKEIWKALLPASGSTYPTTFEYKGCQYILTTATGGIFYGFNRSNALLAFKLKTCKN